MNPRTLTAGALLALHVATAGAADLLQVWEAAQHHDPQGIAIDAARDAGAARRGQGAALWRPAVSLNGGMGVAHADSRMSGANFSAPGFGQSSGVSFGTSVEGGTATRWTVGVRQALYNPERSAQQEQLSLSADAAEIEWQAARQEWMLQITQRYFDLVLAERRLALLQQQRVAVDRAYQEAKDRYDLGNAPITDTHEAAARARGLMAQAVAASNDVDIARGMLADFTGMGQEKLNPKGPLHVGAIASVGPQGRWLDSANQANPMVRLRQVQADAAAAEVRKHTVAASATVDLVAQVSRDRLSGSGDYGAASNTQNQTMVGVALSLPLYTGGGRSARLEEAVRTEDKLRAELARTRLLAGQMTRAAWLSLSSGQARLAALEEALSASRARLEATRLGRQVGDRTTLELLNAENDSMAAELALLQARIDILLSRLRLDASTGRLNMDSLRSINACLEP